MYREEAYFLYLRNSRALPSRVCPYVGRMILTWEEEWVRVGEAR